jgi:DNA helicase-2/ATP-dependent DNA helicase PcrA
VSDALGRGIVIPAGAAVPPAFEGAPVVVIDDDVVGDPGPVVAQLHERWLRRLPVVVELRVAAGAIREPETDRREPWQVGAAHEFTRERLQHLVWANNWDARGGEPVWWWARKAARLGASEGGPADIVLDDGTPAWVDGGPRQPLDVPVVHAESVDAGRLTPARFRPPSADLAPDQLAAVAHRVGPARVIAPAGSGKTRVLTERLRHLVADQGWESSVVTAVAFNKRAADELLARTPGLNAHVRTINALGLAVLSGTLGGPSQARPTVLDEPDCRRILDGLVEVRHQRNTDALAPYLEALSAVRISLRDPATVEAEFPDAVGFAEILPRYRDALARAGAVDFDAQIEDAIRLLLRDPAVRQAAQRRCRHLLVDEFQDLAPAHLLLLRLLAAPGYDVFGVGDDDQVIYGYAGATPSYLIDFERWFPGATAHALEVNYRCGTDIVDGARHLLRYNRIRIDKEIRTPPGAPEGRLDVRPTPAAAMAQAALEAIGEAGSPGDVAVLARVNAALLPVQVAAQEAGIPTTRPLDARVLDRTGTRAALAWLRVAADPGSISRADLQETIRRPSRRVARNVVEMLAKRSRTSTTEIERLARRLSGGDVDKLLGYIADVEAVGQAAATDTASVLAAIRTTIGLGTAMDALDSSRTEADRSTHVDDLLALEQVAPLHPDPDGFESWLRARLSARDEPTGPVVTLSTVHRVKGQEWAHVVIVGAHAEAFPHRLATDVEEERRVFHVAVTRGAESVVVLVDRDRPSPFAEELRGTRPDTPVRGRAAVEPAPKPKPTLDVDADLWEVLRAWRREVATRTGVPAFVVLSDADLRGVAARRPRTMAELRQCRGFGPTKLERYGDELLAVLESPHGPTG